MKGERLRLRDGLLDKNVPSHLCNRKLPVAVTTRSITRYNEVGRGGRRGLGRTKNVLGVGGHAK